MEQGAFTVSLSAEDTLLHFFDSSIKLDDNWPDGQAQAFLLLLAKISFDELLSITDCIIRPRPLDTERIPQFADTKQIDRVVQILIGCGEPTLNYKDLGYYLLRSEHNDGAFAKYGENHGKGASLLGLANNTPGEFACSTLTQAYANISDAELRKQLRLRLYLRIPLLQELLYCAKNDRFNGYDAMRMFSRSTMIRRAQSPKKLFKELHATGNEMLQQRIDRIFWQE